MCSKRVLKIRYTDEEIEYIKKNYKRTNLVEVTEKLGRTKYSVCRVARRLGLTDNKGVKVEHPTASDLRKQPKFNNDEERSKYRSEERKKNFKENGHPRGMLGKTHDIDFRKKQSKRLEERWKNKNDPLNSDDHRDKLSEMMSKTMEKRLKENPNSVYTNSKGGTREDLGFYVRSAWEANYARYLNWLKQKGEIHEWEYEVDTFWFEKIKRGTRSYTPDFKVWKTSTEYEYHEVKGYMDQKSKTKLKRMEKYYPNETVLVIGSEEYKAIKEWSRLISNWE